MRHLTIATLFERLKHRWRAATKSHSLNCRVAVSCPLPKLSKSCVLENRQDSSRWVKQVPLLTLGPNESFLVDLSLLRVWCISPKRWYSICLLLEQVFKSCGHSTVMQVEQDSPLLCQCSWMKFIYENLSLEFDRMHWRMIAGQSEKSCQSMENWVLTG